SVLNRAMTASLDELFSEVVQARAYRGVVEPVAYFHDQAAEQLGIDPRLQDRLLLKRLAQLAHQTLSLVVSQGGSGAYLHAHPAGTLIVQLAIGRRDGAEGVEPVMLVQDIEEIAEDFGRFALEGRVQQMGFAVPADGPTGQDRLQLRLAAKKIAD